MTTTQLLQTAPDLDTLARILNDLPREEINDLGHVLTDLPTFGGAEPRDTRGIWSWDEKRLLVSGTNGGFRIEPREA